METLNPSQFAIAAQPFLGVGSALLAGPTKAAAMGQASFTNPGEYVPQEAQSGGWRDALKKAWAAVNPLSTMSPTQESIAYATKIVAKGGGEALAAAAKTVTAASSGVKTGFQTITILLLLLAVGYLFLMFSPFIPKPSSGGR